MRLDVRRHADAAVGNLDLQLNTAVGCVMLRGEELDPSVLSKLDGVGGEIEQHLADAGRIALEMARELRRQNPSAAPGRTSSPFRTSRMRRLPRLMHVEIDGFRSQVPGLDAVSEISTVILGLARVHRR
jgi:hypothetical protein